MKFPPPFFTGTICNLHRHHGPPMHPVFTGATRPICTGATGPPNIQLSPAPRICVPESSTSIICFRAVRPSSHGMRALGQELNLDRRSHFPLVGRMLRAVFRPWGRRDVACQKACSAISNGYSVFEISGTCLIIARVNIGSLLFVTGAVWAIWGISSAKVCCGFASETHYRKWLGTLGFGTDSPFQDWGSKNCAEPP